jgi:hypothetical protein
VQRKFWFRASRSSFRMNGLPQYPQKDLKKFRAEKTFF